MLPARSLCLTQIGWCLANPPIVLGMGLRSRVFRGSRDPSEATPTPAAARSTSVVIGVLQDGGVAALGLELRDHASIELRPDAAVRHPCMAASDFAREIPFGR
jgi:hypothetical protein